MTVTTDETQDAARGRVKPVAALPGLPGDFAALAQWLQASPGAMMRAEPVIQLPFPPGLDHAGKLAWLEEVAASWGVQTVPDALGGRRAEKRFGALRIVAHVGHPDRTYSGHMARVDAALAAQAGSPVAA